MLLTTMTHSSSSRSPLHVPPLTVSVAYPTTVSIALPLAFVLPPSLGFAVLGLGICFHHPTISLCSLHLVSSSHPNASSFSPPLWL